MNLKKKNLDKKIYSKQFYFYIIILEFFKNKLFKDDLSNKLNYSININKSKFYTTRILKNNMLSYLRAPHRNKKAQVLVALSRYKINVSIFIDFSKLNYEQKICNLYKIIKIFFKKLNFFESNLIYIKSYKIVYNYKFSILNL